MFSQKKPIIWTLVVLYSVTILLLAWGTRSATLGKLAADSLNYRLSLLDNFSNSDAALRPLHAGDTTIHLPSILDVNLDYSKPSDSRNTDFYVQGLSPHSIAETTRNVKNSFRKNEWLVTPDEKFFKVSLYQNDSEVEGVLLVESYEKDPNYRSRLLGIFTKVN